MTYQLRSLKAKDAITVLGLVNKLGLKEPLKAIFEGDTKPSSEEDMQQFGVEIVDTLIEAVIPRVEQYSQEVHAFLGDLAGLTIDEVEDLSLVDYFGLYRDFFTHRDFKDLVQSFMSSMKK